MKKLQPCVVLPSGYPQFLEEIKVRIQESRAKAALSVNRELIALYWHIGKSIVERQESEGWGRAVVDRFAADVQKSFPGIEGFSPSNVWRMRAFYLAWAVGILARAVRESGPSQILTRAVSEFRGRNPPREVSRIPWGHNIALFQKLKDPGRRLWYARMAIENGWSLPVLVYQIESGLYERQGRSINNFKHTLPSPQSRLAQRVLKDPYNLDFLTALEDAQEREIERGLVDHIRRFLLELGNGFAFVGQQVHLEVQGDDFYIDLLFYHLRLRCFVVIELKNGSFKPEYAGKMNFYLSAVDDRLRHRDDRPSIGMILCRSRKKLVAEYALRDTKKPIGVAIYALTKHLPRRFQSALPSVEEIEAAFIPRSMRESRSR